MIKNIERIGKILGAIILLAWCVLVVPPMWSHIINVVQDFWRQT